ncbi:bifunctional 2-polyprenyl-6-hydroxyphenol methylase/3-demethylubiquinol 3-O-methyltransferase UbiG [Caulobacter sp. UNC279MFTsu5.1]|uniref:class I SAM-dependent methyltransferase n=1 Tax=Caulobacter sp. UNC279MFTsu5.1 TaxID=1502775 RepID=UPI000371ABCD|nr:DUF1698 domain-containing protein [Caulobacter sp. UNC279MFTsu5.1]SFJ47330.1 Protein of unknown function [Caulobacter sp. UNC279MFTsu5.1]
MAKIETLALFEQRRADPENALDLFDGQWISKIPGYRHGHADLFEDHRIRWLGQQCGGFKGKSILEMGPLEGAHTFMMARDGASNILAIENNARAYLKCLVVKETLKFNADFLLGDGVAYLEGNDHSFDFLLCSGVIYHMTDPLRLLSAMAARAPRLGIWTHFYDGELMNSGGHLARHFAPEPERVSFHGREFDLWPQYYEEALDRPDFAGGMEESSRWLTRDGLLSALEILGYKVTVGAEYATPSPGPSITLYCERGDE